MVGVDLPTQAPGLYLSPKLGPRWRRKELNHRLGQVMPGDWLPRIRADVAGAGDGGAFWMRDNNQGDALVRWLCEFGRAANADMSESAIRDKAGDLAVQGGEFTREWVLGIFNVADWERRVSRWLVEHGGPDLEEEIEREALQALLDRMACAIWWRKRLRRWVAQNYERGAVRLGFVGAGAGQWYCSDKAVRRRMQQNAENALMLQKTKLQSTAGQTMTLADIAAKTVSNKAIRRGELMTRIKGCEQWADSAGLVGLFTTNTCPSRFHAQLKGGGKNPKFEGESPADAQAWLKRQWAKLRALWHREGLRVIGFRVAEPHHDGCPHWHMLLWCRPCDSLRIQETMRAAWLSEYGEEPGARDYRVNIKPMQRGLASGYIAKYISKNIDDVATTAHVDADEAPGLTVGPDLLGDLEVRPCQRVEAWAALWRIRQFQGIGQPPVTVWRELRRMDGKAAASGSDALMMAWVSCHREREKLADWCAYMRAQGGPMLPRQDYRLCLHRTQRFVRGRYSEGMRPWVCGVFDRMAGAMPVAPSKRMLWGGEGFAAIRAQVVPWTRLNNCTQAVNKKTFTFLDFASDLVKSGFLKSEVSQYGNVYDYLPP